MKSTWSWRCSIFCNEAPSRAESVMKFVWWSGVDVIAAEMSAICLSCLIAHTCSKGGAGGGRGIEGCDAER
jgi:hypothetical protein